MTNAFAKSLRHETSMTGRFMTADRDTDHDRSGTPSRTQRNADARLGRVLVVDDDPLSRRILAETLRNIGAAEVVTAENGLAALAVIDAPSAPLDLICVDLQMPDMDGIQLFRALKDRSVRTPLILISAVAEKLLRTSERVAEGHGLNVAAAMPKPVAAAELLRVVQTMAPDGRAVEAGAQADEVPGLTEEDLRAAIQQNALEVHYQPKVEPGSRRLASVEALVRWNHPEHGAISPGLFVPLAEKTGLIEPLTAFVLEQALAQTGRWHAENLKVGVAINMAPSSLMRLDLPDRLEALTREHSLPSDAVTIEITERDVLTDAVAAIDVLARLRMQGIGIALDDFGTGYSTLQQLQDFPFSELKIDRAFVSSALQNRDARAILKSSVELGRQLDLQIVAEGVETPEVFHLVGILGVHEAQGWFIGRAMPGDALSSWYRNWREAKGEE